MRCGPLAAALTSMSLLGCTVGTSSEDVKVAKAEYGLAHDAFQHGRYREALEHVERSLEIDESNTDSAYLGGMIMLFFCAQDGDSPDCRYEEAERFVRTALKANPEMRDAKNALGVILVHRGKAKEAAQVLEPLAKDILYRSPEKAWGNLGWAYLEAGRVDDAIPALKRAVASQPLFCVGHYRLGLAYEKKGAFAAARQSLSQALAIEEGDCARLQAAFSARARVLKRLGDESGTIKNLEQCRELASSTKIGRACARELRLLE